MATATKKARAATGVVAASDSVSMEFLVVEDNGGDYHWTLLDRVRQAVDSRLAGLAV